MVENASKVYRIGMKCRGRVPDQTLWEDVSGWFLKEVDMTHKDMEKHPKVTAILFVVFSRLNHDLPTLFAVLELSFPQRTGPLGVCPLLKLGLPNPALPNLGDAHIDKLLMDMAASKVVEQMKLELSFARKNNAKALALASSRPARSCPRPSLPARQSARPMVWLTDLLATLLLTHA